MGDSGEYFLSERQRKAQKMAEKQRKSIEKREEKRIEKAKVYQAPPVRGMDKKNDAPTASNSNNNSNSADIEDQLGLDNLKNKFAKAAAKRKADYGGEENRLADFIDTSGSKKKKKHKR